MRGSPNRSFQAAVHTPMLLCGLFTFTSSLLFVVAVLPIDRASPITDHVYLWGVSGLSASVAEPPFFLVDGWEAVQLLFVVFVLASAAVALFRRWARPLLGVAIVCDALLLPAAAGSTGTLELHQVLLGGPWLPLWVISLIALALALATAPRGGARSGAREPARDRVGDVAP